MRLFLHPAVTHLCIMEGLEVCLCVLRVAGCRASVYSFDDVLLVVCVSSLCGASRCLSCHVLLLCQKTTSATSSVTSTASSTETSTRTLSGTTSRTTTVTTVKSPTFLHAVFPFACTFPFFNQMCNVYALTMRATHQMLILLFGAPVLSCWVSMLCWNCGCSLCVSALVGRCPV